MKSFRMHGIGMLLGLCALPGAAGAASVESIVSDTQRMVLEDGKVSLVWWIPLEFWAETMRANTALPAETRDNVIAMMSDYAVVALLRASPGEEGLKDIQPKEALTKNTRFEVDGKVLQPLTAEKISPVVTSMVSQLKPMLAEAIGPAGEAMDFLVYPATVGDQAIIDAGLPGTLTVLFYGKTFKWRLPLGSLMPPKTDTATGETFPGNFQFNPYTGKKLAGPTPAATPAATAPATPAAAPVRAPATAPAPARAPAPAPAPAPARAPAPAPTK